MRKVLAGLIILGVFFGLALKITGCSQEGGGETSSTTSTTIPLGPLSVSGTVYGVLQSGYNQMYYYVPADITDLTVTAYSDKDMTNVVVEETIDMSERALMVDYSLTGFSPNTTYYLKATQRIDLKPAGIITQTLYSTGTKTLTFLASDLTGQNIFMTKPTL